MTLWRISRHDDLEGLGGERTDGRWHTAAKGRRVVYLSEHPAVALLEVLANLKGDPRLFPDTYRLMKIVAAPSVSVEIAGALDEDWRESVEATRAMGDAWLASRRSALLRVPSAPSPESWNYLLNPLHAEAGQLVREWTRWVRYDRRLFHVVDGPLLK
jgi:RES domain-containing protein